MPASLAFAFHSSVESPIEPASYSIANADFWLGVRRGLEVAGTVLTSSWQTMLTVMGSPSSSVPKSKTSDLNENSGPSGASLAFVMVAVLIPPSDLPPKKWTGLSCF